ncbi:MAG TPA: GNAT family N-acetyltransferase, partial [Ignavibacteriaceae bacterium]|nr:GNAT family N-acetyltransferase [Ignavibacteriaceae bacterium]
MLTVRKLIASEISFLQNFPPEDWKLDLPKFISFHFRFKYFYPIVAEIDKKIVGFGNGLTNGKTGWIGNILVKPEYRRQGIGHMITAHLVEYFKTKGCRSQLLIASEMGKNIYSRLGFRIVGNYNVYKSSEALAGYQYNERIRAVGKADFSQIKIIDKKITGEERSGFI